MTEQEIKERGDELVETINRMAVELNDVGSEDHRSLVRQAEEIRDEMIRLFNLFSKEQ